MASAAKKDPLSRYFKDLDEFDIRSGEESEDDEEVKSSTVAAAAQNISNKPPASGKSDSPKDAGKTQEAAAGDATKTSSGVKKAKLPSASECLSSQSSPAFLRLAKPKEVDWDQRLKSVDGPEGGGAPIDFTPNAVPPPSSYEPVTDTGIKVVDEDGNRKKRMGDDLPDQMTSTKAYKVHKAADDEDT